jgi:hypothetical protein
LFFLESRIKQVDRFRDVTRPCQTIEKRFTVALIEQLEGIKKPNQMKVFRGSFLVGF